MIATAKNIPVDALKTLWYTCFGDPYRYINFFFDQIYRPDHALVWEEDGQVRSMLFLLDCFFQTDSSTYNGAYIYAACTHPDFRSKGYMAALIKRAQDICEENGLWFTALVPANDPLYDYYRKFGYETAFYCMRQRMQRNQLETFCEQAETTAAIVPQEESLAQIRNRLLDSNALLWKPEVLSYALAEHQLTGGQTIHIDGGYLLYHEAEDICRVDEWICSPAAQAGLLQLLMRACSANEFVFYLPPLGAAAQMLGGHIIPKGMLRVAKNKQLPFGCGDTQLYIGLTLG